MKTKVYIVIFFNLLNFVLFGMKVYQPANFTGHIITNISVEHAATGVFSYVPEASYTEPIPYWQMTNYVAKINNQTTSNLVTGIDTGNGSNGNLTVSSAGTVINNYTYLTGNESSTDTTITLNNASSFSAGDEILIIQIQDGANGNQGVYEFADIQSISGNNVTLTTGLSNNYYSGTFDTQNAEVAQVVSVPNYADVTINSGASITANDWVGYSGGIVAFRATGIVSFISGGKIDVSLQGFRGGHCNAGGNNAWGQQGEGYIGLGTNALANNGNGGGGGYGPTGYGGEPGAGGGHASSGGDGISAFTSTGGVAVGSANFSSLFFGGGGGGGGDNDGFLPFPIGGDGGGIVMIFANAIINPNIASTGDYGIAPGSYGGTSGGGAGGAVWLAAKTISNAQINVTGGKGGVYGSNIGGNGSGGRTRIEFDSFDEVFHIYEDGVAIIKLGFFQGYLTTSVEVGNTTNYFRFEAETRKDTNFFSHSNSSNPAEVTLEKAGWYKISYEVCWFQNSGDVDRHVMHTWAEKNDSEIIPSSSYSYTRDESSGQYNSCAATFIFQAPADAKIKLGAERVDGAYNPQALANKTWIMIEKI